MHACLSESVFDASIPRSWDLKIVRIYLHVMHKHWMQMSQTALPPAVLADTTVMWVWFCLVGLVADMHCIRCMTACDWYQAVKYWRSFCETLHRELIVCILLALKLLFPREHALRLLHGIHVRWHVVLWYVNSDHYIFFADVTQIQWVINCTQVSSYD